MLCVNGERWEEDTHMKGIKGRRKTGKDDDAEGIIFPLISVGISHWHTL
jgi:hypothetical protein